MVLLFSDGFIDEANRNKKNTGLVIIVPNRDRGFNEFWAGLDS